VDPAAAVPLQGAAGRRAHVGAPRVVRVLERLSGWQGTREVFEVRLAAERQRHRRGLGQLEKVGQGLRRQGPRAAVHCRHGTGAPEAPGWCGQPRAATPRSITRSPGDLRKLRSYKYLIYLSGHSWSSSFQRIISAGAAVFVPQQLQHETIMHVRLRECPDCFLFYDAKDPCESVKAVLANTTDEQARGTAERLASFVADHMQHERVLDYSAGVLNAYAAAASTFSGYTVVSRDGEADHLQLADGGVLPQLTCARLKEQHRSHIPPSTHWQIDEWFDEDCLLRRRQPAYLAYVAV